MHAEILRSKVKKKNERKSLILEKKERYRRGRETIINILCYYFLYYLIQRKEKKMMERCTLHLQTQKRFLKFGKKGDENFGRKRTRGRNNKNKEKEFKKEFKNLRRNEDNGYNEERDEQCFWNEDRYWIEVCDESNI